MFNVNLISFIVLMYDHSKCDASNMFQKKLRQEKQNNILERLSRSQAKDGARFNTLWDTWLFQALRNRKYQKMKKLFLFCLILKFLFSRCSLF